MYDIKTGIITIESQKEFQIVDITDQVNKILRVDCNLCNVFVQHTTAAIGIVDVDKGTQSDMVDSLNKLLPEINYRFSYNPEHMDAHILATMIGMFVTIPVVNGKLLLGEWQRLVLIELNGPRKRHIAITGIAK